MKIRDKLREIQLDSREIEIERERERDIERVGR